MDTGLARRKFLARIGVLGLASSGLLSGTLNPPASAHTAEAAAGPINLDLLRKALQKLSVDTFNGLGAFVVPGDDDYSTAQGTPSDTDGAIAAKGPEFLMGALDAFVGLPDATARQLSQVLAMGLSDAGVELPILGGLGGLLLDVDEALAKLLATDETIPLSFTVASLLNLLATQVDPASTDGAFLSPFARLSFEEKVAAFELLEQADSDLVALLDVNLPEPVKDSVSGLLKFMGGALIEFMAFGTYSEYAMFDPETKTLTGTPLGWDLAHYEHRAEGYDSFRGYYQGRKEVSHA